MAIREQLVEKIQSLPEDKLKEIADFIGFLEAKVGQSELSEHGMEYYLDELSAYEEMLAAGNIEWK